MWRRSDLTAAKPYPDGHFEVIGERRWYLLCNGILGDRRPAGGNVLTLAVLQALKSTCRHDDPKVVHGEACRLGPARLAADDMDFKQIPDDLGAR